jgi:hypothetical protein
VEIPAMDIFGVFALVLISVAEFIYTIKREEHGKISPRINAVGVLFAIWGMIFFLGQILHLGRVI